MDDDRLTFEDELNPMGILINEIHELLEEADYDCGCASWDYRVVRWEYDDESSDAPRVLYTIEEIHYDENGNIIEWIAEDEEKAGTTPMAETLSGLIDDLDAMREALSRPYLNAKDLPV